MIVEPRRRIGAARIEMPAARLLGLSGARELAGAGLRFVWKKLHSNVASALGRGRIDWDSCVKEVTVSHLPVSSGIPSGLAWVNCGKLLGAAALAITGAGAGVA
jgi:hypothetical protein